MIRWFVYPLEIIAEILKYVVKIISLYLFWLLVLAGTGNDAQINELLAYFLISAAIGILNMTGSPFYGRELRRSIRSGEMNNFFIKPVNILPYYFFRTLGKRSLLILVTFIGFGFAIHLSGGINFQNFLFFVPMLIAALLLGMSLNILEGALTFYLTEISGLKNMLNHVIRIFSGALVPLYYFPEWLRNIIELTPFPGLIYGPTQALLSPNPFNELISLLIVSVTWSVIFYTASLLIWKRALSTYEAIGA